MLPLVSLRGFSFSARPSVSARFAGRDAFAKKRLVRLSPEMSAGVTIVLLTTTASVKRAVARASSRTSSDAGTCPAVVSYSFVCALLFVSARGGALAAVHQHARFREPKNWNDAPLSGSALLMFGRHSLLKFPALDWCERVLWRYTYLLHGR